MTDTPTPPELLQPVAEPEKAPPDEVRFRRSHLYAALLPLAFVAGLGAGFLFWGRDQAPPQAQAAAPDAPSGAIDLRAQQGQVRLEVSPDDDAALGPEDAPVTIIEFSDFNCRYCRRFHHETFGPLLERFADQIRFVYRDFPVVGGFEAAQAAECAREQGDFWGFHDALFNSEGVAIDRDLYQTLAEELGLHPEALIACLEEGRYAAEVEADARYAASLGINGTPTFFINGIPIVGAQPLTVFTQIIEAELSEGG